MKRNGWMIAVALVVVGNLVALSGAALNRRGEPDATVALTERELPMDFRTDEDSGLSLSFQTNPHADDETSLDEPTLSRLGFDVSVPADAESAEFHYGRQLPREGYVVLECEGTAWADWIASREAEVERLAAEVEAGRERAKTLEHQRAALEQDRRSASRLFVIAAGADPVALRAAHPDRTRQMILPAVFGVRTEPLLSSDDRPRGWVVRGSIQRIVGAVHVGLAHRSVFDGLEGRMRWIGDAESEAGPRYRVTVHVGRRHEPWIASAERIDGPPSP